MLVMLMVGALASGALFTFRLIYFGALFPQPVTAKYSGVSWQSIVAGLHYLKRHAWNDNAATAIVTVSIVLSVAVAAAGELRSRALNLYVVLALLFAAGYLSFAVLSGGDWMEGGRFLVHFLPVAIAFVPLAVGRISPNKRVLVSITAILMALQLTSGIAFARNASTSVPLWGHLPAELNGASGRYSWFEGRSRINVRDMQLIDRLDEIVTQISSRKSGPVLITSGQMGMVSYYIALRHFGHVRFLDRHGLVDRGLTDCSLTRDGRRDTGGLAFPVDWYFENLSRLEQTCGLSQPDVVFDLGRSRARNYGYEDVYAQTGVVEGVGTRLSGDTVLADSFVAVNPRVSALPDPLPVSAHFGR
jgi:hypothetical protein